MDFFKFWDPSLPVALKFGLNIFSTLPQILVLHVWFSTWVAQSRSAQRSMTSGVLPPKQPGMVWILSLMLPLQLRRMQCVCPLPTFLGMASSLTGIPGVSLQKRREGGREREMESFFFKKNSANAKYQNYSLY